MFKHIYILLATIYFFLFLPHIPEANNTSFNVAPIFDDSQDEGVKNYFSITSEKEYEGHLKFLVTNRNSSPITITPTAVNALTSPNGVIQYTKDVEMENSKLNDDEYRFTKYLQEMNDLIIPADSAVEVSIPVSIPLLNGEILGGISFKVKEEPKTAVEDQEFIVTVTNELNTIIAVQIDFGKVNNSTTFDYDTALFTQTADLYAFRIPVKYSGNAVLPNSQLKLHVENSKGTKLFDVEKEITVAPKTDFSLMLPWQYKQLSLTENYRIKGTITNDKGVTLSTIDLNLQAPNASSGTGLDKLLNPTEKVEVINGEKPRVILGLTLAIIILICSITTVTIYRKSLASRKN